MSVTYTVTETSGHVHTRTSARHTRPEYPFAVVRAPGCAKNRVSFHSTRKLAEKALGEALSHAYQGKRTYPDAKLYPVTATVKGAA